MPIFLKNVASAYAGLGAKGTNILQMADIALDKYAAASDTGVIDDPQVYRSVAKLLAPYGGKPAVQERILEMEANARQLETRQTNALDNQGFLEAQLEEALLAVGEKNYKNIQSLIFKTAELYNVARDNLYDEVIPSFLKQMATGQTLPESIIKYGKMLDEKAQQFTNLTNSYLIADPETGFVGPPNPDAWGVFIQTNTDNGQPVSIKIKAVNSLDKEIAGYIKTEKVRYGRMPVYLNTTQKEGKEIGRLLDSEYEFNDETKLLKGEAPKAQGIFGKMYEAATTPETLKSLTEKEQELDLSGATFGGNMVGYPLNSVLRDTKQNYYYLDNSGKLWKAQGKDEMQNYLNRLGRNGEEEVNRRVFLATSDFVKGNPPQQQLIDASLTGGLSGATPIFAVPSVPSSVVEPTTMLQLPKQTFLQPKGEKKIPLQQGMKEFKEGQGYTVPAIIEKGKQFFKSLIPKF